MPHAIRRMTTTDLPRVLEIERASFAVPWRRDTFESLMRRGDADLLVQEDDGTMIGYAVIWTIADQAELGDVAVHPDRRGNGAGRRLVRAAVEHAAGRGARDIFLEVRVSNAPAIALYESEGFESIGRRRRYYSRPVEDALVMRKSVVNADGVTA